MKPLFTFIFLFLFSSCFTQENTVINLAFSDTSNFRLTKALGHAFPSAFYVLDSTTKWNEHRFHIDEDLSSPSVVARLKMDEHSWYNSTYIFSDTLLDRLFNEKEKLLLSKEAAAIIPRQIKLSSGKFRLIRSFSSAVDGFFFSVSDPVYSSDRQWAFLEIITFRKDPDTESLNDAYFGTTVMVYRLGKTGRWVKFNKIDRLIL